MSARARGAAMPPAGKSPDGSVAAPSRDRGPSAPIALLVSDIDGTLVTPSKTLTPGAVAAVRNLATAGIAFTLVSSRPPRGMARLVARLALRLPFGAFNGGSLVAPDLSLISAHRLLPEIAQAVLALFMDRGVEVWVFADGDWFVRHAGGANDARERRALGFEPKVRDGFSDVIGRIDKVVGVSDDLVLLHRVEVDALALVGGAAAIKVSQPGHLDVTHPLANKGEAVSALSRRAGVDLRHTAVIGDSFNDVPMFARAGFSVAMGQGPAEVRAQANAVTLSNAHDGFASAVERFILPTQTTPAVHGPSDSTGC